MRYLPIINLIEQNFSGEWGTEPFQEPKIKIIRNTNFTNEGKLNLNDVVERSIPKNKIRLKSLKYGDIIIEKSGGSPNQPVGRVVFYDQKDGEYLFSNFTSALRSKNEVNSRYLFYLLFAHHCFNTTLSYQNKTTGILNLQLIRYLKETKIPFPPLEAQKKIAAILDKADELRQNDQKILEKYDQLAQSLFLEMFGDPIKNSRRLKIVRLEDITTKITDGVHAKPNYVEKGVPFISVKDITTGVLEFDNCKFISKEDHLNFTKRCKPEYDDILYTKVGATYGRPALVDKNFDFSIYVSVALIKPKRELVNSYFLKEALAHPAIKRQADKAIKGIGVPDLHLNMIKEFVLPLPTLELQEKYASIMSKAEDQKKITQQSIQKSEALFQSLLQRAFRGELE